MLQKTTKVFDVIIIGAGPSGLSCAEALGNSGLSVLILEKNNTIGPKVCAGGLTVKDIKQFNIPEELIEYRFNAPYLHVNNLHKAVKTPYNFIYTIDRHKFSQWQLSKLNACKNILVKPNSKVTKITNQAVLVNDETIGYKYLIGCDGSNSVVKNYLGIKPESTGTGIQYLIPTDKYRDIEFFFEPKYFSAMYAWIFPHKGYVSIGCCCNNKDLPASILRKNFEKWLSEKKIDVSNGKFEAFAMNYTYQGYQFDNVFLGGDAAGLLFDFSGEGIYQAIISGQEIARHILNKNYKSAAIENLLKTKHRHSKLLNEIMKAGNKKILYFYVGFWLSYFSQFKRKAINILT
ncbi:MAG: NAD(P)/FAD-dependent oxidoreductase [Paludibacter sp.]|nr:NAD(P)/FAD-dependent oxidoreductase [Paludibacter sp.]